MTKLFDLDFELSFHLGDTEKKEEVNATKGFVEEMKGKLNALVGEGTQSTPPTVQNNGFTFERKSLTADELNYRYYSLEEYRSNEIQYELVEKNKTNKGEQNSGLKMLKTAYFNTQPTEHVNAHLLVNDYHSPFRSFDSLYKFLSNEECLMELLVSIDREQMVYTHQAKMSGVSDEEINNQREVLEGMKGEVKKHLQELTKEQFGKSSLDYMHRFVKDVIFSIYPLEQEYEVFIIKPRSKNHLKSLYFEQVINRYQHFFNSNENILVENEEKTMAILICLKGNPGEVACTQKEYKQMLGFKNYYNYMDIK